MQKLLISSKSFVSLMSTINTSSLRLDNVIQLLKTPSVTIGLQLVFSNLSAWQSARVCSLCRSRRILIGSFSELRHGSSLTFEINESNCSTTGLSVLWPTDDDWLDDKPSSSSLHLLARGWTVVKRAPCRWCHRTRGHASSGTRSRLKIPGCTVQQPPRCGSRCAQNLKTVVLGKGAPRSSTTSWKMKLMGRRKDKMTREKMVSKRQESGAVEENQTHNMSAWGWHMKCDVRTPNLWLERRVCVSLVMQHWEKCDVWGLLFTPSVGCSRLLSAVNDLTTTKKSCKVSLLSNFVKKLHNGSHRSFCCSFTSSDVIDFLWFFMSSTKDRSTATMMCWMKKTTDAISDTARKESVRVALLQTHGEDGASLLMLRWSLNDLSPIRFFQIYWERSTNSFCIESTRLATCDRWNLFCASLSIWMHISSVRSMLSCESRNLKYFWKRSWIPAKPLLKHLFLTLWAI